jgi:transposase
VFAIDIAKEKQYALLTNDDNSVSELFWWNHPEQTPRLLDELHELACPITVVMESTGTYGDALRYQFRQIGCDIYQVSAKRVSDAREVFDGVPSLHDAKAATIITRLHRGGLTHPWQELTAQERELNALRREYDMHQSQYQRNQSRLEANLIRHWPEVCCLLALDSVTLEHLLQEYGSAERIAADAEAVAQKMKCWGKSRLTEAKIAQVIDSAAHTLGQPCTEAERHYLQSLAEEMRHNRCQQKQAKQALEAIIRSEDELHEMAVLIGLGLNLKERSSGRHIGRLKLTKRGSSIARRYLYFAALRLIRDDPVVKRWYHNKVDPRVRNKAVIAVMRKLAKALWHVGRGEVFDANKLLTVVKAS